MAFQYVLTVCAVLVAAASAGILPPAIHYVQPAVDAVAATHHNVVRNFDGTVSTYSKAVDTPYSSVRKVDSRITNNVYAPAVAKTVTTYAAAAPVYEKYAAAAPAVYAHAHAQPIVAKAVYAAPAVAKTVTYAAPSQPAVYHQPAAPVYHQHAAPAVATTAYSHGSDATTFTHAAPGLSGYGSSQTVRYSPAEMVSHMSFDGFGTHWGF